VAARPTFHYIHHVSYRVDDLGKSLDFYERILGCEPQPRPDVGFPGAWLQLGDLQFHLMQAPPDKDSGVNPRAATSTANHVAISVDDCDAVKAYFKSEGVAFTEGWPGQPQFFVQDPDGNVIELTTRQRA
jgi:glyoxylase I family protein